MKITNLRYTQREELLHLREIAEGEGWAEQVEAYDALLNGQDLTPSHIKEIVPELEWHQDKFAPARATQFAPAEPGDPKMYRTLGHLIRKLEEIGEQGGVLLRCACGHVCSPGEDECPTCET